MLRAGGAARFGTGLRRDDGYEHHAIWRDGAGRHELDGHWRLCQAQGLEWLLVLMTGLHAASDHPAPYITATRIDVADLNEPVRKLAAIAAGIDL